MAVSSQGELLFTFNWRLENFSMLTYKTENLFTSPTFLVPKLERTGWCIRFDATEFCCRLSRQKVREDEPETVSTSFSLAVLATDGDDLQGSKINVSFNLNEDKEICFSNLNPAIFVDWETIFMPKDTLRIKCCFRRPAFLETKHEDAVSVLKTGPFKKALSQVIRKACSSKITLHSEKKEAAVKYKSGTTKCPNELTICTRIEVEHRSTLWPLSDFSQMEVGSADIIHVSSTAADLPSLGLGIHFTTLDRMVFQIVPNISNTPKQMGVSFSVDIVNEEGDSLKSIGEETHIFPELTASDEKTLWQLSSVINRCEILQEKRRYLRNDVLYLRIEIAISYEGRVSHTIGDTRFSECSIDSCRTEIAVKDIQLPHLYEKKKYSDVTLNVSGVAIPVHKAVICSASSVFDAMFSNDIKESNTGEVNIPDFDFDTMDKLLIFIYSGALRLKDMDIKEVVSLYSAADKYQILGLQEKCSDFLKSAISEDSVCHILKVAELLRDVTLRKETIKFISVHALAKFTLDKWQLLLEKNPSLATDVMY